MKPKYRFFKVAVSGLSLIIAYSSLSLVFDLCVLRNRLSYFWSNLEYRNGCLKELRLLRDFDYRINNDLNTRWSRFMIKAHTYQKNVLHLSKKGYTTQFLLHFVKILFSSCRVGWYKRIQIIFTSSSHSIKWQMLKCTYLKVLQSCVKSKLPDSETCLLYSTCR